MIYSLRENYPEEWHLARSESEKTNNLSMRAQSTTNQNQDKLPQYRLDDENSLVTW